MNSKKIFAKKNRITGFFLLLAAIVLFILAGWLFLMYIVNSMEPVIGKLPLG
jgi:high-affinity Fe2+/Pb2+ permease